MKNFNEKYIIRDFIDKNKWSNVYKCINKETNEKVILNVLINLDKNKEKLYDFQKEIDILKSMDNSNLISIKDMYSYINKDKTCYYIESEYFKGLTLRELKERKVLDKRQSLEIIREVIKGIKEFNDREINYRNLTEENIIINEKGIVKIDVLSFINKYEGYLNCHKILEDGFDEYEDVYMIGRVLCRLITGKRSFNPGEYNKNIDVDLSEILMKSTNKKPGYKDNYRDLNEFLYEVDSYIEYGKIKRKNIVDLQNNLNMKKYIVSAACSILVASSIIFGGKKILNSMNKENDISQVVTPSEEYKNKENNKVVSSDKIEDNKIITIKEDTTKKDEISIDKFNENITEKEEDTKKEPTSNKENNKEEKPAKKPIKKPIKKPVQKPAEEKPSIEDIQKPEDEIEDEELEEEPSIEDIQKPENETEDKPEDENNQENEIEDKPVDENTLENETFTEESISQ